MRALEILYLLKGMVTQKSGLADATSFGCCQNIPCSVTKLGILSAVCVSTDSLVPHCPRREEGMCSDPHVTLGKTQSKAALLTSVDS